MTLKDAFLAELQQEANNTRNMLQAVSNDILDFRPDHKAWNTAQLCSHIAESYYWYVPTFEANYMDFAAYKYDKGDISNIENIIAKFEENLQLAVGALQSVKDDAAFDEIWVMKSGDKETGSMPRGVVVRSMLMNHLYHHRGQLSIYIRAAGKRPASVYGPTQENLPQ